MTDSRLAIGQYVRFLTRKGLDLDPVDARSYQNFFVGQSRVWEGNTYLFAPFAISGDIGSTGDSGSSTELVMPANILSGAALFEASEERLMLRVKYVLMNEVQNSEPPEWVELSTLADQLWVSYQCAYTDDVPDDLEGTAVVVLSLASPFGAAATKAMQVYLSSEQVGTLPPTGRIVF